VGSGEGQQEPGCAGTQCGVKGKTRCKRRATRGTPAKRVLKERWWFYCRAGRPLRWMLPPTSAGTDAPPGHWYEIKTNLHEVVQSGRARYHACCAPALQGEKISRAPSWVPVVAAGVLGYRTGLGGGVCCQQIDRDVGWSAFLGLTVASPRGRIGAVLRPSDWST